MCHHGVERRLLVVAMVVDPVDGRCTSVGMTRQGIAATAPIAHAGAVRE